MWGQTGVQNNHTNKMTDGTVFAVSNEGLWCVTMRGFQGKQVIKAGGWGWGCGGQ